MRVWLGLMLTLGCAPAMPAWSGGSTTPRQRTDVAAGGAVRVALGDLKEVGPAESRYREAAEAPGMVPVGLARVGLTRHQDLGLMVAGTTLRLETRGELWVKEGSTRSAWVWAVAPFYGWIPDDDDTGRGSRLGLDLPFAYGSDFGGLYDVWLGVRLGAERVWGDFQLGADQTTATATALRAGAFLGIAAGFRRVHAFAELTVAYEAWFASHGEEDLDRGGVVLTPAFGLRIRI